MNFYLIYGPDKSLINKEYNKIIKSLNVEENSIIKYDINENNLKDIIEDANMINLFGDKKIIKINDADMFNKDNIKNTDLLVEYFENYNEKTIMIFIYNGEKIDNKKKITKLINKIGKVIFLDKKNIKLDNYIKEYIEKEGYKISNQDINYLITKVGTNIDNITNELDKLLLYKIEDKIINKQDIEDIAITNNEDTIFSLIDAIRENNLSKSLSLYNEFINQNYDPLTILIMIANQYRLLYQVKVLSETKTQDQIATYLEIHPYRVKLARSNSYYFSEELLLKYLNTLSNIEIKIKSGEIDKNLALEMFIINKDITI